MQHFISGTHESAVHSLNMWSIDTLLDCDLVVFQYRSTRDQIPSIYIVLANQLSKYSALCVDVHFVVAVFDAENVDCHLSCNKKIYRHLKMCAHEIVYTKKGQFFFPISIAFFHKKKMTWANICYHSKKLELHLNANITITESTSER